MSPLDATDRWQDVCALCDRFDLTPPERLATRPGFVHKKRRAFT